MWWAKTRMWSTDLLRLFVNLEGRAAVADGVQQSHNPYPDNSADHTIDVARQAWLEGWDAAAHAGGCLPRDEAVMICLRPCDGAGVTGDAGD